MDGPYVDFQMFEDDLLTSYGQLYRKDKDGEFGKKPTVQMPPER